MGGFKREIFELEPKQDTIPSSDSLFMLAIARQLFDYALVATLVVDLNGFVLHLNTSAEQLFGYSKEELIGQKIEILVPDGLKHRHTALRESFIKTPARRPMGEGRRLSARHKAGHSIPIEIGLNPLSVGPLLSAVIISVLDQSAVNRAERAELFAVELKHRAKKYVYRYQRNFAANWCIKLEPRKI